MITGSVVVTALLCAAAASAEEHSRLFGVLPNYATVDAPPSGAGTNIVPPITKKQLFHLADMSSYDPAVFPFVALKTSLGAGGSDAAFGNRYATALADNAIANFMKIAVLPSLTNQDSRYYRSGEGGVFRRIVYAARTSVITRTRDGGTAFNISAVGGNLAAAGISNLYYAREDRTVSGTMSRWGSQMMWGVVSRELKEFWPDIRAKLHKD